MAPVHTIFPELKIKAVVLGSLILIITAANRLGLYSAFLACKAIFFKSSLQPRFTVQTMFLKENSMFENKPALYIIYILHMIYKYYSGSIISMHTYIYLSPFVHEK